jgi:hypothetical protein
MLAPAALREQLVLGLEQGGDTRLPRVELRRRFKPFVEDELPALLGDSLGLVAHPLAEESCPRAVGRHVTLAIGPEGGFIPYEVEALQRAGCRAVSLGAAAAAGRAGGRGAVGDGSSEQPGFPSDRHRPLRPPHDHRHEVRRAADSLEVQQVIKMAERYPGIHAEVRQIEGASRSLTEIYLLGRRRRFRRSRSRSFRRSRRRSASASATGRSAVTTAPRHSASSTTASASARTRSTSSRACARSTRARTSSSCSRR